MVPVWMTLNDLWPKFRGHDIIQREVTRKWYKVELCLQWRTNRKSYYGLSNSAIFNDLVSKFQGHAIFDAEYLRNGTIYRHSFNGILIGTYILTVSFRMTLSDLAKYPVTRSVARSLCDSWASCKDIFSWLTWLSLPCAWTFAWSNSLMTLAVCVKICETFEGVLVDRAS